MTAPSGNMFPHSIVECYAVSICHIDLRILVVLSKVIKVDLLGNLANYKEDYNAPLFDVVCTVTVMIFCSKCDASLIYWLLAHLHLKAFYYLCTDNVIFQ